MKGLYIENLQVSYGKHLVLEDLELHVETGSLTVLLGPSGCGKSSLLKAVSGILSPDRGRIGFQERSFYDSLEAIYVPMEQRDLGFVFQNHTLWPHMTVEQNVAYPLKARGIRQTEAVGRVRDILRLVSLSGYEKRLPQTLSGGEKQRVALARSLVYAPSLLLMDEPLASLDAYLKSDLAREIRRIQRSLGLTMLYVTHDQQEAFELADRIVVMKDGRIRQQGSPQEIYDCCRDSFVASFIGRNNVFCMNDGECPKFLSGVLGQAACIRPEDIVIRKDGRYQGVVRDSVFCGDRNECAIESDGVRILARTGKEQVCEPGQTVRFDVRRVRPVRHHAGRESWYCQNCGV